MNRRWVDTQKGKLLSDQHSGAVVSRQEISGNSDNTGNVGELGRKESKEKEDEGESGGRGGEVGRKSKRRWGR